MILERIKELYKKYKIQTVSKLVAINNKDNLACEYLSRSKNSIVVIVVS